MKNCKYAWLAMGVVLVMTCFVLGTAYAVTVTVQTTSGASTSATYYTQPGDSAIGDATISSAGAIEHTTSGSVEKGLIRAESGGNRAFTPYTGDFSATANAGPGGGASSTATSTNARVDVFVVTQGGNESVGNYTIDGVPGAPPYGSIGAAVGDAEGEGAPGLPDWIVVGQGTYTEQVALNNFEDNSALTSAWGRDDTTIDSQGLGGPTVDVNSPDYFYMEGFTVRGGTGATNANGVFIRGGSENAEIRCNRFTDNDHHGIRLSGPNHNAVISNNIIDENRRNGVMIGGSDDVEISNNTITGNTFDGVNLDFQAERARVTNNEISGNQRYGIDVAAGSIDVQITGNNITGSQQSGIHVDSSNDVEIRNNVLTGNSVNTPVGGPGGAIMVDNGSLRAQITDNTVSDNRHNGIWVGNGSNSATIDDNIVTNNDLDGITVSGSTDADVTNNVVTNNDRNGIAIVPGSHGADITNNTVLDNLWDGIHVRASNGAQITSNIITGNGQNSLNDGGIRLVGPTAVATTATINGNNIEGNFDFGFWSDTPGPGNVDVTNNWWGAADGPSPIGSGDHVRRDAGDVFPTIVPFSPTPFALPLP